MTEIFFIPGCFFLFGIIVGSFLNVCIVRMPHELSIVTPRSHCPQCKHPIAWYDNVPLLSYIFLAGKCRHCKAPISFRYFLVELLTGLTFVGFYFYFGLSVVTFAYLVMACCFIIATFVDFAHRIIPDEISVGGMVIGLMLSFLIPELHVSHPIGFQARELALGRAAFGVFIGGGSIYFLAIVGDLIFRKESMGGGDVKLMAMVGAFLGWKLTLLAFFIAPFFGAVYGIVEKIRTKDSAIAYGPFLVLGSLISLFWGTEIINWILGNYGIYNPH